MRDSIITINRIRMVARYDKDRFRIEDGRSLVQRTMLSIDHDEAVELGVILAEFINHSTKGNK